MWYMAHKEPVVLGENEHFCIQLARFNIDSEGG